MSFHDVESFSGVDFILEIPPIPTRENVPAFGVGILILE